MPSDDSRADRRIDPAAVRTTLVAALDEQRLIGADGDLPWHLPADLRHFKQTTLGYPVVMGRRTFESLGGALPGRRNLVLTGQRDYEASQALVVHSLDEARAQVAAAGDDELMVLGGSSVFQEALPGADKLILTVVHGQFEGDTYFPDFDGRQWKIVEKRRHAADKCHAVALSFVTLVPVDNTRPRSVGVADRPGPLPTILTSL